MIITVGGTKGGSGKSTIATNLAIIRSNDNFDVLLVDADDQQTAADFTIIRNDKKEEGAGYTSIKLTGAAVRTEILRLKGKYQDIIIDTGGRDTTSQRAAITISDVLLIPFKPRSFDVWTVEKVSNLVAELRPANPNLKVYAFINMADPRGQDNNDAAELLKEGAEFSYIETLVVERKAFSNAASLGIAVTELKPQDQKATEEIMNLYRYIFDSK